MRLKNAKMNYSLWASCYDLINMVLVEDLTTKVSRKCIEYLSALPPNLIVACRLLHRCKKESTRESSENKIKILSI